MARNNSIKFFEGCGIGFRIWHATISSNLLNGIVPSHYRKKFVNNMKFNEDKREQIMSLDYNQKQLLQHLLEESENILYENDSIKIKVKEGHTLCSIQTSKDVKSTITHCNDEIIIDIAKV